MRDTGTAAGGTKAKTDAMPTPRDFAEKGGAQARESFEKMSAAAVDASNAVQNTFSTANQGARDYNAKVIEFARQNCNATFDYARELLAVKSPSEFLETATKHARKQVETMSEQARELTELGQKVMRESAEPLNAGIGKAVQRPMS